MEFPSEPVDPSAQLSRGDKRKFACAPNLKLQQMLNLGKNRLDNIVIELDPAVDSSDAGMNVDLRALLKASPPGARSQILTRLRKRPDADFVKRVFAYGLEDQAADSTYCLLGPYWAERLGKSDLQALQISANGGRAPMVHHRAKVTVVDTGIYSRNATSAVSTIGGTYPYRTPSGALGWIGYFHLSHA
ncbi:hypothetical protein H2203_000623 [Taxawa tesnikishii (nom. ined.)]|nr:hypothetical protein H2203_000623 [Dothideales sp. JES 119]